MKYIVMFIGFLAGYSIATFLTDSSLVQWIAGVLGAVLANEFVRFIHYIRYTPQQLLAFHGPDSPITRTTSSGDIRSFLSKFHEEGLLIGFDPRQSHVKLDENQWAVLSENEKITLCQVLTRAVIVDGGHEPQTIQLTNRKGNVLALYSTASKHLDRKAKEKS
jgi:hypothetical protein